MKKITAFILILILSLSLCACGEKKDVVMKVGDTEISAAEYEYTYHSQVQNFYSSYADYLSYFGIDPEKPLDEQKCTVSETEQTWAEYFMDQTEEMLTQVFCFYNAARDEGMELSEESQLQVDAFVLSATEAAQKASMTLEKYLSEYYGEGLTTELYREFISHRLLATQYCDEKLGATLYEDADFEAYYADNRASIDKVTFRVYTMTEDYLPADSSAVTETEVAAEVKKLADAFAEGLTSEQIFMDRAVEYAPEDEKDNYASAAATLAANISSSDLAASTMSEWLFDEARKEGDVSVHATGSGAYTICYFVSRQRDEHPLAGMRHILLSVTVDKDGNSDDAAVYEEIKGLYTQWEKSGFSEDTFISLASANTDDPGSKETGGLYASFAYGTMVSEINDWIYAEGRKTGDSSIIKTDYGYHLVWFTGYGEIAWKEACLPGLQDEDYYELLDELEKKYAVEFSENHRETVGKK